MLDCFMGGRNLSRTNLATFSVLPGSTALPYVHDRVSQHPCLFLQQMGVHRPLPARLLAEGVTYRPPIV